MRLPGSTFFPFLILLLSVSEASLRIPKTRIRASHAAASTCPTYPLPTASSSAVTSQMSKFLEELSTNVTAVLQAHNAKGGVSLSIVYNDTIIWNRGFGLINETDPSLGPPTGDTAFRVGSITKLFTALLMYQMRDEGLIKSIDSDVSTYNTQFSIKSNFQTNRSITFKQLASHMSGLPRESPCAGIFETGCTATYEEIYQRLAESQLMLPPGLQPSYSNLGFALLGRSLEVIDGPTWESLMQKRILGPLGMAHSGTTITEEVKTFLAVGYYPDGSVASLIDIGWEAPAGQLFSTTNDLAKFMTLIFQSQATLNPASGQIVDGETLREWMNMAYTYLDGSGYGHPWETFPFGNFMLRTKAGLINGYTSEFRMAPEIKIGYIFLDSCDECSSHGPIIDLADQIFAEANNALAALQTGPSPPPNLSDYIGSYQISDSSTATIQTVTILGVPVLEIINDEISGFLVWQGADSFQFSVEWYSRVTCNFLSDGWIGEWLYFTRNTQGAINGFTLPGEDYGNIYKKITEL